MLQIGWLFRKVCLFKYSYQSWYLFYKISANQNQDHLGSSKPHWLKVQQKKLRDSKSFVPLSMFILSFARLWPKVHFSTLFIHSERSHSSLHSPWPFTLTSTFTLNVHIHVYIHPERSHPCLHSPWTFTFMFTFTLNVHILVYIRPERSHSCLHSP